MLMVLLALIILFASLAMLMPQGMWTSALSLVNVTTAALLAINFWEPLATWIEGSETGSITRRSTYLIDFVVIWFLFAIILTVLRAVTDLLSKFKVRFIRPIDVGGGAFFGLWTGWVLVCFTMMTLHMAPLGREFLFGSFQPENRMVLGTAPDRQMLGFMQNISMGAFSRGGEEHVFDPNGEFMLKYAARRKEYASVQSLMLPAKK